MPEANAIARSAMTAWRHAAPPRPESDAMRAARRARRSHQINQLKTSQPAEPARHRPDIIKLF
ncbi:hypothetical protein A0U87_25200 [Sphingobium sp. MP9-4]|uniref:hypothetical protein n=1 Tax=Sphingobium sp. MP9-4 TaxID=1761936 RepID=UPI00113D5871